jgi:hypothetical protein
MGRMRGVWLPAACLLLTSCPTPSTPPGGTYHVEGTTASGFHVSMDCAPIIPFNATAASVSGVEIPISHVPGVGIKVGTVALDQNTLRQSSDLIEALDNAQFSFCRVLPFIPPQDVYKLYTDSNTQLATLSNLLRNLNSAQTPDQAKAAIATAANTAATTASAPPTVVAVATPAASAAPTAPAAPAAPAAPTAPAAPAAPAAPTAPAAPAAPTAPAAAASTPAAANPQAAAVANDAVKAATTLKAAATAAKTL